MYLNTTCIKRGSSADRKKKKQTCFFPIRKDICVSVWRLQPKADIVIHKYETIHFRSFYAKVM